MQSMLGEPVSDLQIVGPGATLLRGSIKLWGMKKLLKFDFMSLYSNKCFNNVIKVNCL